MGTVQFNEKIIGELIQFPRDAFPNEVYFSTDFERTAPPNIHSKTTCPEFESLFPCQSAVPIAKPGCSFAFGFCLSHADGIWWHLLRKSLEFLRDSGFSFCVKCADFFRFSLAST